MGPDLAPDAGRSGWRGLRRWGIPLAVLAVFGSLFALLLLGGTATYFWTMSTLFRFPVHPTLFLDTYTNLSWLECARQGVDVFRANPCDTIVALPMNYTPVWLWGLLTPLDTRARLWIGALHCLGFVLALGLLPPPRGRGEFLLRLAATLSPAVAFALERGNAELSMFAATALGCALILRDSPFGRLGYLAFLIPTSMKMFPAALFALAVRERPGRCLAIGVAAAGLLGAAAWLMRDRLRIIVTGLIPSGSPFGDMFGAKNLVLSAPSWAAAWPGHATGFMLSLLAAALLAAFGIATRRALRRALSLLPRRDTVFAAAGAILLVAAFVAAQNSNYRTIHALFLLPALCVSWRNASAALKAGIAATLAAVLFVLWSEFARSLSGASGLRSATATAPELAFWMARELAWWWLFVVMCAFLMAFAWASPALRGLSGRLSRPA